MNDILEFNINSRRNTDYAFVHVMKNGAKVCLHFPKLKMGESMQRFDSYQEAESYALKINADKNMIDVDDVVLATVDTSVCHLNTNSGLMTGAFIIKDAYGNILESVIYNPEDNRVNRLNSLELTAVAEIKTVVYMLKYLRKKGYTNVIVNYDNLQIRKCINSNNELLSKSELNLVNELRNGVNALDGQVIFQHLKSHIGHRTLDTVDAMAKKANIARNNLKREAIA